MSEQYPLPEAERKISLRNILTYGNPNLIHYHKLIEREHGGRYVFIPQEFSQFWEKLYFDPYKNDKKFNPPQYEKAVAYFIEKMHGSLLIDVGGGSGTWMQELAKKSGVQKYINVDVFHDGESLDPYSGYPAPAIDYQGLSEQERAQPMEEIYVRADMLDFVARLPNNSANFAVNGIDMSVEKDREYREALITELIRATQVGGILFGSGSDIWRGDERLKFVAKELGLRESESDHWRGEVIIEKIKE